MASTHSTSKAHEATNGGVSASRIDTFTDSANGTSLFTSKPASENGDFTGCTPPRSRASSDAAANATDRPANGGQGKERPSGEAKAKCGDVEGETKSDEGQGERVKQAGTSQHEQQDEDTAALNNGECNNMPKRGSAFGRIMKLYAEGPERGEAKDSGNSARKTDQLDGAGDEHEGWVDLDDEPQMGHTQGSK